MRNLKRLKNKGVNKHNKNGDLGISERELSRRLKEQGCPICLEVYASLSQWIYWPNKNIVSTKNIEAMNDVLPTCNVLV